MAATDAVHAGCLPAPGPRAMGPGSGPAAPPLTVEVLGRLPPQGLQGHLGVRPLQHQPPAVQVSAVTQGVEGSLGTGREIKQRVSEALAWSTAFCPACTADPKVSSGPYGTCSRGRSASRGHVYFIRG